MSWERERGGWGGRQWPAGVLGTVCTIRETFTNLFPNKFSCNRSTQTQNWDISDVTSGMDTSHLCPFLATRIELATLPIVSVHLFVSCVASAAMSTTPLCMGPRIQNAAAVCIIAQPCQWGRVTSCSEGPTARLAATATHCPFRQAGMGGGGAPRWYWSAFQPHHWFHACRWARPFLTAHRTESISAVPQPSPPRKYAPITFSPMPPPLCRRPSDSVWHSPSTSVPYQLVAGVSGTKSTEEEKGRGKGGRFVPPGAEFFGRTAL